ncbi:MAG: hypothetical protein IJQ62_14240 [Clostridia bacterium]|nr:hypothetical protein [Clostridia bacterium]
MSDSIALVNRCMDILCDAVGVVEAEKFIHFIKTESFDYTKWQRKHYDAIPPEQLREDMKQFCVNHPFTGKKAVRL